MGLRVMKNPVGRPIGYKMTEASKLLVGATSKGRIPVNRRKVSIEGVIFDSIKIASNTLNHAPATIRYRLLSDSKAFEQWLYV